MKDELAELAEYVKSLLKMAAGSEKSDDAMRFSQAACNAANAIAVLLCNQ